MTRIAKTYVAIPLLLVATVTSASAADDWERLGDIYRESAWLRRDTQTTAATAVFAKSMGEIAEQLSETVAGLDLAVTQIREDFDELQRLNIAWFEKLTAAAKANKPDAESVHDADTYQAQLRLVYDFRDATPVEDMLDLERQFILDIGRTIDACHTTRNYLLALAQSRGIAATAEHAIIGDDIEAMGRLDGELSMQAFWLEQMRDVVQQQRAKRQVTAEAIRSTWTYMLRAELRAPNVESVGDIVASVEAAVRGDDTYLQVSQLAWAATNRGTTLLRSYHSPVLARRAVLADLQRFRDITTNLDTYPIDADSRERISVIGETTIDRLKRSHGEIYAACQNMQRYVDQREQATQQILDSGVDQRCQAMASVVLSESPLSVQEEAFRALKDRCR